MGLFNFIIHYEIALGLGIVDRCAEPCVFRKDHAGSRGRDWRIQEILGLARLRF